MEVDRGLQLGRIRSGTTGGVWEMGEERTFDGSSHREESGRKRGKLPSNP